MVVRLDVNDVHGNNEEKRRFASRGNLGRNVLEQQAKTSGIVRNNLNKEAEKRHGKRRSA